MASAGWCWCEKRGFRRGERVAQAGQAGVGPEGVEGSGLETVAPVATSRLGFWDAPQNTMDPGTLEETVVPLVHFPGGVTALSS